MSLDIKEIKRFIKNIKKLEPTGILGGYINLLEYTIQLERNIKNVINEIDARSCKINLTDFDMYVKSTLEAQNEK